MSSVAPQPERKKAVNRHRHCHGLGLLFIRIILLKCQWVIKRRIYFIVALLPSYLTGFVVVVGVPLPLFAAEIAAAVTAVAIPTPTAITGANSKTGC